MSRSATQSFLDLVWGEFLYTSLRPQGIRFVERLLELCRILIVFAAVEGTEPEIVCRIILGTARPRSTSMSSTG